MTGQNSIETNHNFADILIIGAGPAGIAAAKVACAAGARVVVVDRSSAPGKKACAGGLTREAMAALGMDAARMPGPNRFHRISVVSPKGRMCLESDDGEPLMVTIDRCRFQSDELARLRDEGVSIRLGERLLSIDGDRARTDAGELRFGFLIGADGTHSRVRRHLGLEKGLEVRALQASIPAEIAAAAGVETDRPSVWFDAALMGSGYAWAFPFDGEVRFGLGVASKGAPTASLRTMFGTWLSGLGLSPDPGRLTSGTIGCGFAGYRFGKVYLAGDAAGLASPLTGEGIAQALVSGADVAREITEPGFRSDAIPHLAARHRRTLATLEGRGAGLLDTAPWLLRVGRIRRAALRRFVY